MSINFKHSFRLLSNILEVHKHIDVASSFRHKPQWFLWPQSIPACIRVLTDTRLYYYIHSNRVGVRVNNAHRTLRSVARVREDKTFGYVLQYFPLPYTSEPMTHLCLRAFFFMCTWVLGSSGQTTTV